MSLNYVTITGTFDDGSGTALSGTAIFTPSQTVFANGIPLVSAGIPVSVAITGGILQSVHLLATDNTGLSYEGGTGFFFWSVSFTLGGVSQPGFSFFLPHTPATVDLTALANTAAAGGFANPMTTLGDLIYENATPAATRLAGNTAAAKNFLTQTGTGSVSAAPAWGTIAAGDVPGFDGVTVTGTPSSGQIPTATGSSAATWQSPASVYQPWQFRVAPNGAKYVTDAAITTATNALACATSTPFVSGDVGKTVMVQGAGASGGTLVTTISGFTNSGHVTLTANAGTTVSAAGMIFGTDDLANINSAVTSAVTYAQAHTGYAEVLLDAAIYMLNGALTQGGSTKGNAQIPLPVIATTANKVTLVFRGARDVSGLPHWQQNYPQISGTVLATSVTGTNDATYGEASVIGGPTPKQGYGQSASLFNNMLCTIDGVQILNPNNPAICGFDFRGMGEANVISGAVMGFATPATYANPSSTWQFGLAMPENNNNDNANIIWYSAEGQNFGVTTSEHTTAVSIRCLYCVVGIEHGGGDSGASSSTGHGAIIQYASVEACQVVLGGNLVASYPSKITIQLLSWEPGSGSFALFKVINDPGGNLLGDVWVQSPGNPLNSSNVNGAVNLRLYDLTRQSGPVASPVAAPATGVAWVNPYYWNAEITLSLSGGTLSALTLTGAAGGVSQTVPGSTTFYRFMLPTGASYTPTYTGTLTHTVTLF